MEPFLRTEVVMNALGLVLMGLTTFLVARTARRLDRHEARTDTAMESLAALTANQKQGLRHLERMEEKLDAHLLSHH